MVAMVCMRASLCAPMTRMNFHFPKLMVAKLRKLSMLSGVPVAEIVRRAVKEYLDKHGA